MRWEVAQRKGSPLRAVCQQIKRWRPQFLAASIHLGWCAGLISFIGPTADELALGRLAKLNRPAGTNFGRAVFPALKRQGIVAMSLRDACEANASAPDDKSLGYSRVIPRA